MLGAPENDRSIRLTNAGISPRFRLVVNCPSCTTSRIRSRISSSSIPSPRTELLLSLSTASSSGTDVKRARVGLTTAFSSVDYFSAVRMQHLAGEVGAIIGCKKDVAGATSSGSPGLPSVVSLPNDATLSAGNVDGISGVQIGPGATALTRIPRSAKAFDKERVNATMAPFVAE